MHCEIPINIPSGEFLLLFCCSDISINYRIVKQQIAIWHHAIPESRLLETSSYTQENKQKSG